MVVNVCRRGQREELVVAGVSDGEAEGRAREWVSCMKNCLYAAIKGCAGVSCKQAWTEIYQSFQHGRLKPLL